MEHPVIESHRYLKKIKSIAVLFSKLLFFAVRCGFCWPPIHFHCASYVSDYCHPHHCHCHCHYHFRHCYPYLSMASRCLSTTTIIILSSCSTRAIATAAVTVTLAWVSAVTRADPMKLSRHESRQEIQQRNQQSGGQVTG